jgi:putative ABC transport system permease protein
VSDDYHAVMGIPILAGRAFDARDHETALPVAIVSRSLAERFWPGRDPLGRRFRAGDDQTPWLTVVGVSGDVVHHWFARRNYPTFYRPFAQEPSASITFALRTDGDPEALALAARQAVRAADPDLPAAEVRSMRRAIGDSTIGLQYGAAILAAFGGLALVLAASGVYGVMAYRVSLRRREFGVRLALGATGGDLVRLSLGQALRLLSLGLTLGLGLGYGLTRAITSAFQGAIAPDPASFLAVAAVLAAATVTAAAVPARRVLALDPARVLRAE